MIDVAEIVIPLSLNIYNSTRIINLLSMKDLELSIQILIREPNFEGLTQKWNSIFNRTVVMYSTVKHLDYFLLLCTVINNHYCENTLLDDSHLMVHIQCGLEGSIVKLDSIFK